MPKLPRKRTHHSRNAAAQAKDSHRQKQQVSKKNSARKEAPAARATSTTKSVTKDNHPGLLKGWAQISEYLGQPVATAQRWAKTGMPARREGRFMVASPDELNMWLGKEAGVHQPLRIATGNEDLSSDLRRALAVARHHRRK